MWNRIILLLILAAYCSAGPLVQQRKNMPIMSREEHVMQQQQQDSELEEESDPEPQMGAPEAAPLVGTLTLPSNATSIRADITDNFSCTNKSYGYYADVENDCQIFHVCLPVTYADGKENTFRWSFICPEETVFSQESFTCMRREDMTIDCADSYRYYELNGNFGLPVEEEKRPAATSLAVDSVQELQQKPQPDKSDMLAPVATPTKPEPIQESVKPFKVQKTKPKPNRRKPAITYNNLQRKVPVVVTEAPVVQPVEESQPEAVFASVSQQVVTSVKPQRFSVRPVNKEKPQFVKPAVPGTATPIRNELVNSIRNRPTMFNKVQATTPKPVEEIELLELPAPRPTLKLQSMFIDPAPIGAVVEAEPITQASKSIVSVVQPNVEKEAQLDEKPTNSAESESMQNLGAEVNPVEAIPEIPAVIVESLEEKPTELKQTEIQPAPEKVKESHKMEESRPMEPSISEPNSASNEEPANIEAMEGARPADAPVSLPATPEMEHPSPLVEEMLGNTDSTNEAQASIGGFRPVDPVVAAEAEQLITDFLNTLRKQEEKTDTQTNSEQLNVDIDMAENIEQQPQVEDTQPKPEAVLQQKPESEAAAISIEEAKLPEPEIVDNNASIEEQLLESEPLKDQKPDSPIINIMQLNHLPADYQIPVQVVVAPEPEVQQEVMTETRPEADLELKSEAQQEPMIEAAVAPAKDSEGQFMSDYSATIAHDDGQESQPLAGFIPPISIDDIVELVKERLDHNPKNERLTPMELVLTPGAAEPMTLLQSSLEPKPEAEHQAIPDMTPVPGEDEEHILPIYNRIFPADPFMSAAQIKPITVNKVEEGAEVEVQSLQEETAARAAHEVHPSRIPALMDARKRRFLFRADVS